jgi:thioredoxin-related protein
MSQNLRNIMTPTSLIVLLLLIIQFPLSAQTPDATLTIHLRGIYNSKISLILLAGSNSLRPIFIVDSIKNGETIMLKVPKDYLPGEFVLRFDYKENSLSTPYPSEKKIIVYDQDIDLYVHPIYCNNGDSTWFQKDERENSAYSRFLQENSKQKSMLSLLQNFLLNYNDPKSAFYRGGITEYEKRRKANNQWINEQINQHKTLFVSRIFAFQRVPNIDWKGSESDRKQSLMDHFFEGMDFSDPLMIKTTNMKEWMDGYVNLYGELATTVELRDSLFTLAGKTAIEKARMGHPLVYGWMVDYFFNGYESFKIDKGIKMLEPYMNDPDCLTAKRKEINKRLKGIETLVPGTLSPDIIMIDDENKPFELNVYQTEKKFILLLFWSADCSHCTQMVGELYPLSQQKEVQQKLEIVAISMDETDTELRAWQQKITELKGWTHLQAKDGLRSKVANDYYILGVPVMILLNSKTKEIISLPESSEELKNYLELQ